MIVKLVADNFCDVHDIFSDSDSNVKDSVIRRRQNKTVYPFSDYNENNSVVDNNDVGGHDSK